MKHPIFHPNEEARIGPYPHSADLCGRECKIVRDMGMVYGEYRYLVELTDDKTRVKVLELTLQKVWERSDWGMLRGIWQPDRQKRVADAASGWEELKEVAKKDPYRFHRQIGQDAIDSLKKLYDDSQKARRSKSWKEFK